MEATTEFFRATCPVMAEIYELEYRGLITKQHSDYLMLTISRNRNRLYRAHVTKADVAAAWSLLADIQKELDTTLLAHDG